MGDGAVGKTSLCTVYVEVKLIYIGSQSVQLPILVLKYFRYQFDARYFFLIRKWLKESTGKSGL